LFDSVEIEGKNDFLANHFLDLYTVEKLVDDYRYFNFLTFKIGWPAKLLSDKEFRFTNGVVDSFGKKENQYLRLLYEKVNGNGTVGIRAALSSELNEKTGIMTLNMNSEYEGLTLGVLNNIYEQLSYFFITKSVEKQKKTYEIMRYKRDSVLASLKTAEYKLADFKDSNRNLVTVKGYLNQIKLEREVQILNIMYGEVVKQLEITDFTLRNMTPVVQIIDLPRKPIISSKASWKKKFAFGFIIGLILTVIYLVVKKFFMDVMAE
jgi:tetrahydromethanopterin S-methyltransferase subunit B